MVQNYGFMSCVSFVALHQTIRVKVDLNIYCNYTGVIGLIVSWESFILENFWTVVPSLA